MLEYITFALIGGALGAGWREIYELRKKIEALKPKNKAGVTMGAYSTQTPLSSNDKSNKAVVTPKSPQQLELERQQREMEQTLIERGTHPYGNN